MRGRYPALPGLSPPPAVPVGGPGPGPARPRAGSAGVSTPQSVFDGSDRQGRGRLIDALRHGAVRADRVAAAAGWPDDPERAARVAGRTGGEGLVARDRAGTLRLP